MAIALDYLKKQTGIKSLAFQVVYFPPNAPRETKFVIATSGAKIMLIISIYSLSKHLFQCRPTQMVVDYLAELLGGKQPIWWTSTY